MMNNPEGDALESVLRALMVFTPTGIPDYATDPVV
jgi:hypothetical protein